MKTRATCSALRHHWRASVDRRQSQAALRSVAVRAKSIKGGTAQVIVKLAMVVSPAGWDEGTDKARKVVPLRICQWQRGELVLEDSVSPCAFGAGRETRTRRDTMIFAPHCKFPDVSRCTCNLCGVQIPVKLIAKSTGALVGNPCSNSHPQRHMNQ